MKIFLFHVFLFLFFGPSTFADTSYNSLKDQKRLESQKEIIGWILSKKEAPLEITALAKTFLAKNNQLRRSNKPEQIDQMLMQWNKIEIPRLQKKYPLFFYEQENILQSQMQEHLGPVIKTRRSLPFDYLKDRVWGFRPVEFIQSIVIHHTQTEDIGVIYKKHTAEDRFEGDVAPFMAYHFLIDKRGAIYVLNRFTDKVWHARAANGHSLGIALLGNLDEEQVPLEQYDSLLKLIRFLTDALHLNPQTSLYAHGELKNDGNDTRCPGVYGKEIIRQIKYQLNRKGSS